MICASARLTAQNIAFSAVARAAIMEDENFHGGDYYEHGVRPDNGLSLARRIAHITYLSEESMRAKFGRRLQPTARRCAASASTSRSRATSSTRARASSTASTPTATSASRA